MDPQVFIVARSERQLIQERARTASPKPHGTARAQAIDYA